MGIGRLPRPREGDGAGAIDRAVLADNGLRAVGEMKHEAIPSTDAQVELLDSQRSVGCWTKPSLEDCRIGERAKHEVRVRGIPATGRDGDQRIDSSHRLPSFATS